MQNPATGFNAEFKASSSGAGNLRQSSRMGAVSTKQFNREKGLAQRLGKELWMDERFVDPVELLLRLGGIERLFPPCDEEHPTSSEWAGFWPGKYLRPDAAAARKSWQLFESTAALVECERYLHEDVY